jgi:hypothetical protein
MAIRYGKPGKIIARRFTIEQLQDASGNMSGFCLACGEDRDSCERDAHKYHCDSCHNKLVYGAEEILLRGYVNN